MKKIIKGLFIPLVVSTSFGFVCAKLVYSVYKDDIDSKLSSSKIYLLQNGEYTTYDNMREENSGNNYVYYVDNDIYKSVVGITRDYNNIEKIKSLYSEDLFVSEYYLSNEMIDDKQIEYDLMLSNSEDMREVREVIDNILNLYREEDIVRLVLVN